MESIIILLIILFGTLLCYHFIYKVIEPLTCSESGKADAKLSAMDKSITNFKDSINSKLTGLETSMNLLNPLISANNKSAANNKKKLKEVSKKMEDGMNKKSGELDKIDSG